jgi:uncharacterized integral membrane protein (TIGR00697 family)
MKTNSINRTWVALLIAVAGFYIASTLISNVASLRIVTLFGLSIDAGTLIYPLTFTLRDLIHKVAGTAASRVVIFVGAGVNLLMASVFWIIARMTPDMAVGPQSEWAQVLAPSWRIVAASVVAMTVAELLDTEAYRLWVIKFGEKYQYGRVLASNAISVPIDSALFAVIAFGGALPTAVVVSIFWANCWIKYLTSVVSVPLIYLIRPKYEWTIKGQD